jgi:hypothetical protein
MLPLILTSTLAKESETLFDGYHERTKKRFKKELNSQNSAGNPKL